jgi:hypothetical protein
MIAPPSYNNETIVVPCGTSMLAPGGKGRPDGNSSGR